MRHDLSKRLVLPRVKRMRRIYAKIVGIAAAEAAVRRWTTLYKYPTQQVGFSWPFKPTKPLD